MTIFVAIPKTKNEQLLQTFLQIAEEFIDKPDTNPEKDSDAGYSILYNIRLISEALTKKHKTEALTLELWMEINKEKFHFCATDDDFDKITRQIRDNTVWITDPDNFKKPDIVSITALTLEEILAQLPL